MSSPKDLTGTRLGRYFLAKHLATGGMAEIFLAHHDAGGGFHKELVLKILQPRLAEHPAVVGMFLGEARIAAALTHPNIVDVHDVSYEDGLHYIVMEYIPGITLTQLARRALEVSHNLPLDVGAHIVGEIASALAYMSDGLGPDGQRFQVVHRDISPTNILVGNSGHIKVIDFGIARQGDAIKDEAGLRPGKASYMSPEQALGLPIDGRSDIFCLGTILYEITLGRRLWRGPREKAVRRIVEEIPPPPTYVERDYPPALEQIVLRALEKRPEARYQSATEFAADLQDFLHQVGALMRSHHQMRRYLRDIYSEEADAYISENGRERARAFAEGDDDDVLDFDRLLTDGPGAALARALRAHGTHPAAAAEADMPATGLTPGPESLPKLDEPLPAAHASPAKHSNRPYKRRKTGA